MNTLKKATRVNGPHGSQKPLAPAVEAKTPTNPPVRTTRTGATSNTTGTVPRPGR